MMKKNENKGKLIAFDGPNGVGKTTLIAEIVAKLESQRIEVLKTSEPTKTVLGNFIREIQDDIKKEALACLVVGDRYEHLSSEVLPALREGKIVLMDRYILSSYVLQGIDGISFEFIDDLNQNIILPDLQIALLADEKILEERLSQREKRTRFEYNSKIELDFMEKGIERLREKNVNIEVIDNTLGLEINADKIIELILKM